MGARTYYILVNNETKGPYSIEEVQTMFAGGEVGIDTLYVGPGMTEWTPLTNLLFQAPPAEPQTAPPVAAEPAEPPVLPADTDSRDDTADAPGPRPRSIWPKVAVGGVVLVLLLGLGYLASRINFKPALAFVTSHLHLNSVVAFLASHHTNEDSPLSMIVGTNTHSRLGDVVKLDLNRYEFAAKGLGTHYWAFIFVHGQEPINVDKGMTVGLEVDGANFDATNDAPSNAKTNALGEADESIFVEWPAATILGLTNANHVVLHLNGSARRPTIPLTQENVARLQRFASRCAQDDTHMAAPIK